MPADDDEPKEPLLPVPLSAPAASRIPWAELLKRTMGLDVLKCPRCPTGALVVLAFITDIQVVLRILSHLKLPTEVPVPAPARLDPQLELEWDPTDTGDELALDVEAQPRGPP